MKATERIEQEIIKCVTFGDTSLETMGYMNGLKKAKDIIEDDNNSMYKKAMDAFDDIKSDTIFVWEAKQTLEGVYGKYK